ncbi:hypothetical protein [Actinomadura decatromicini]|uniref:Uncharacterized protein n=1 Tax=Actinomadura decatromicini TaxID=2604572 RepID=A0A5D3G0N6_9ACTN|nr:hypothetical protein [Actinomadura decatromicini]TYK53055.1 hypothetical protein FXF68_04790 [Actinomadura decatromicini]
MSVLVALISVAAFLASLPGSDKKSTKSSQILNERLWTYPDPIEDCIDDGEKQLLKGRNHIDFDAPASVTSLDRESDGTLCVQRGYGPVFLKWTAHYRGDIAGFPKTMKDCPSVINASTTIFNSFAIEWATSWCQKTSKGNIAYIERANSTNQNPLFRITLWTPAAFPDQISSGIAN